MREERHDNVTINEGSSDRMDSTLSWKDDNHTFVALDAVAMETSTGNQDRRAEDPKDHEWELQTQKM